MGHLKWPFTKIQSERAPDLETYVRTHLKYARLKNVPAVTGNLAGNTDRAILIGWILSPLFTTYWQIKVAFAHSALSGYFVNCSTTVPRRVLIITSIINTKNGLKMYGRNRCRVSMAFPNLGSTAFGISIFRISISRKFYIRIIIFWKFFLRTVFWNFRIFNFCRRPIAAKGYRAKYSPAIIISQANFWDFFSANAEWAFTL